MSNNSNKTTLPRLERYLIGGGHPPTENNDAARNRSSKRAPAPSQRTGAHPSIGASLCMLNAYGRDETGITTLAPTHQWPLTANTDQLRANLPDGSFSVRSITRDDQGSFFWGDIVIVDQNSVFQLGTPIAGVDAYEKWNPNRTQCLYGVSRAPTQASDGTVLEPIVNG